MKLLWAVLALAWVILVTGASISNHHPKPTPPDDTWLLESWDNGTLILHHQGYVYTTKCESSSAVYPDQPLGDHNPSNFHTCGITTVDYIGQSLPNFHTGKQDPPDANGETKTVISAAGMVQISIHRERPKDKVNVVLNDEYKILSISPLGKEATK